MQKVSRSSRKKVYYFLRKEILANIGYVNKKPNFEP